MRTVVEVGSLALMQLSVEVAYRKNLLQSVVVPQVVVVAWQSVEVALAAVDSRFA